VALSGRLHLVGGRSPAGDTGRHDVYDPTTNRWTLAAPMPTARDHTAAAVVDGVLHVAAGRPGGMAVHEAYDARTGHWSTLAPLPFGRSSVAGAALAHRFLVIGGEDASEQKVYREVDAYDPRTQRWARLRPLPAGLQGIGAVVVGGRLLLPGGGPAAGGAQQSDRLLVLSARH
jgi:hypothetical protein